MKYYIKEFLKNGDKHCSHPMTQKEVDKWVKKLKKQNKVFEVHKYEI